PCTPGVQWNRIERGEARPRKRNDCTLACSQERQDGGTGAQEPWFCPHLFAAAINCTYAANFCRIYASYTIYRPVDPLSATGDVSYSTLLITHDTRARYKHASLETSPT
ncbi:unnamed protein product, partial [Ectocarpus fasciculatus]